ncbi:MAG TPA: hypothetical protein VNM50_10580, partial [Chloroflexota bacterium]|nr:hypothetical protein [Chloroflexota bacterium]
MPRQGETAYGPGNAPPPVPPAAEDIPALLATVERQLLEAREPLRFEQAVRLIEVGPEYTPALVALAHRVRLAYCGPDVELESLLNAKSGGCSED